MKDLNERYRRLYSGVVYDAMKFDVKHPQPFVLHRGIQRVTGAYVPLVGRAFTCYGETIQPERAKEVDRVRIDMLEYISPGDVLVVRTGITHDCSVAHFGDVSALLARKEGAVGAVVDGYTRDADRINTDGFPLYARGSQPIDAYGRWAITDYGAALLLQSSGPEWAKVHRADLVFADGDGVMVIPADVADDVLQLAEKRATDENDIRAAILNGEPPVEIYERCDRW